MSDEKDTVNVESVDTVEAVNVENAPLEIENTAGESLSKNKIGGFMSPVVFLLFMIFAMVVVLAVINLSKPAANGSGTSATADSPQLAAHQAELRALRTELNRERMAMGLSPLPEDSEPIDEIADRLKGDADTLIAIAGRFQQMLGEKDAEISQRSNEIIRLEKLRQDVSAENARLYNELQRALDASSEVKELKSMLEQMRSQRDTLSQQLAETREELTNNLGAISEQEFEDFQRRYDEMAKARIFFENRVKELEAQLGEGNLFARSENELLPDAVELFKRLRTLEGMKDSDINTEYSKLGGDLGANVLHTLEFSTGSSELSSQDMAQLEHIVSDDVPDGDLILIVGYASTTGDAQKNETLSSARATAAAEHFASRKRAGQKVQAVYLGQTSRFSSRIPERNQICEVWRIRRK
ncbi:MAG: OmpA family protein [Luteolibacter sp.]